MISLVTVWWSLSWAQDTPFPAEQNTPLIKPKSSAELDLKPSNPLSPPAGSSAKSRNSDFFPLYSGMFSRIVPNISNLDIGFTYIFGDVISTGSLWADYLVPISTAPGSLLFTESHLEYMGYWKSPTNGSPGLVDSTNRLDLSFGGGYRKRLAWDAMVGVNAFIDRSRIFRNWYGSWGVGVEATGVTMWDCALDFHINMYGLQFNRRAFTNAMRNKGTSFDVQAGFARPFFNQAVDVKLKFAGYQFDTGNKNYGYRIGTEITSRSGLFTFTYQYGNDAINEGYHEFGGFINVALNLENVLSGTNVISAPPPVFASPRNLLRMATRKVERNWHQPTAVILANSAAWATGDDPATPELMLVASRTSGPGAILTLAGPTTLSYSRFLGPPSWTGPAVPANSLERLQRVEMRIDVITADPGAPDFTVGIRFANPFTAATSDRLASVPVPGNTPAGTTVVRILDAAALTGLQDYDAQGFLAIRGPAYWGPFAYRVTVNFYR